MEFGYTIAVEIELGEVELFDMLANRIEGARLERGYLKLGRNILKTEKNPDYDSTKVNNPVDGWEYYRFDLDVNPIGGVDLDTQVSIARQIQKLIEEHNGLSCVLAEFEI